MGQKSEHGSRTHARVKAATSAVFTCIVRDSLSASWSSSWGNGAAASRSIPRVDSSSGWGARWLFDARGLFTHYRQGGRPFRGRVGLLRMGAEQRDGMGPFGRGGSTTVAADWLATTRGRLTNQCQGDEPRLSASGRNAPPSLPQDGVVRCATTKRQHQGKPWTVLAARSTRAWQCLVLRCTPRSWTAAAARIPAAAEMGGDVVRMTARTSYFNCDAPSPQIMHKRSGLKGVVRVAMLTRSKARMIAYGLRKR